MYTCTYGNTDMHIVCMCIIYVFTVIRLKMCPCVCVSVCTWMHTCVYAFVCVPLICVHVRECYVCLYGRTCMYVHACVYAQLKMVHMCHTYVHI